MFDKCSKLKDQSGCKYLQEKLKKDTENAVYYFYPALLQNLLFLIRDASANYFIQKICRYYLNEDRSDRIHAENFISRNV